MTSKRPRSRDAIRACNFIPPRDSGEGGPPEGRWEGRRPRHLPQRRTPPPLVTTGLDPVVHADVQRRETCGPVMSKPATRVDCRVKPGNDETKSRSRDALRARVMPTPLEKPPAEHHRVTPEPAVGSAFGSIMLCGLFEHDLFGKPVSTFPDHARQIKGSGTPPGALILPPRHTGAARAQRSALA